MPLVIGYEYNGRRDTREKGDGRGDQKNSQSLLTKCVGCGRMSVEHTVTTVRKSRSFCLTSRGVDIFSPAIPTTFCRVDLVGGLPDRPYEIALTFG